MNFNTLVNTQGIKGSRRGGDTSNFKQVASKAVGITKNVTVKTATTLMGWAPATNNKVKRVENDSLSRDRELIHEVRKNREALDEVRTMLGLAPVVPSTAEEVQEAVQMMEQYAEELKEQMKESAPPTNVLRKLQEALNTIDKNMPVDTKEEVVEPAEELPEVSVVPPVSTGTTRRFTSPPEASAYDYSNATEEDSQPEEAK